MMQSIPLLMLSGVGVPEESFLHSDRSQPTASQMSGLQQNIKPLVSSAYPYYDPNDQ